MKKRNLIFLFLSFFFLSASAWQPDPVASNEQDYYYRLKKSWQHMQNVFEKINMHYVEEIDPYPLVKAGIDGMLQQLDPYTVFIEEDVLQDGASRFINNLQQTISILAGNTILYSKQFNYL